MKADKKKRFEQRTVEQAQVMIKRLLKEKKSSSEELNKEHQSMLNLMNNYEQHLIS